MTEAFASIITSTAPVFGLVFLGICAARFRWVIEETGPALTQFIFTFAIPALIFRTISTADLGTVAVLPVIGAYFGAAAVLWIVSSGVAVFVFREKAPVAPAISFAICFANVLILAIPIVINRYGQDALAPVLIIIALDVPLMWIAATVQLAISQPTGGLRLSQSLQQLVVSLARNPVIIASVCGLLWRQTEWPTPVIVDNVIELLAKAALPGALFALGMTLTKFQLKGTVAHLGVITLCKLFVLPALVWAFAQYVFGLPDIQVAVLVASAACPVGVNAYLFASNYKLIDSTVAGAVALSTLLSVGTLIVVLALFPP